MNPLSRPRMTQGEPRHKSVSSGWRSSNPDRETPLNARRWASSMRFLSNGCACVRAIGLGRREDARRAAGDPMTGSSGVRGCQCADRGADQRRRPRSNPVRPALPLASSSPPPSPPRVRNGAPGGSFRPAPHRTAVGTAQSRENLRVHPRCRPERSSHNATAGARPTADHSGAPREPPLERG